MPKEVHILTDVTENRARLTPVSVRLYNTLAEMQRLVHDRVSLVGDRRAQGIYCEAGRVLRDARTLTDGVMPPDVLAELENSGRVAAGLRATGPNSVPLDGSKPRGRE